MRQLAAVSCLLLAACSPSGDVPVPAEEPSEAVLAKLVKQSYADAAAGGQLDFKNSSGRTIRVQPKIHSARKDECRRPRHSPEGAYECSLTLMLSLDGGEPSEHGQRIGVEWDPRGEWVLEGTAARRREKAR
ncbi:MAG TPA: hypothetical protein VLF18_09440 [Tahibacter sp.]|uniref:hypothetical protein n=1 Tax=Tahibacter sp. TaxID=2056211 RepID=UPI002B725B6D|nr:hypothetical protein [Tahibacter sp.]HSX60408.1 hypothetical protein [Tahibacter sp.]